MMNMKKASQIIILITSLAVMILGTYLFDVLFADLAAPTFSMQSGFYKDPIALEITTNRDAEIYYTLDGSEPTHESIRYEGPICLTDPSNQPNVYSARDDLSAAFYAEPDRFAVPQDPVDKANVIRAVVISHDGKEISPISTATYWIGDRMEKYLETDVISLVTDPENLFDYEKGIYVAGKTFDTFVSSGARDAMDDPDHWRRWIANYSNSGRDWERPVHFDLIGPDGHLTVTDDAGIRIKGGTSRSFTKKSFRLYARKEYSGRDAFAIPFFEPYGRSKIALFSGAQDYRTMMQDALISYAARDMNFEVLQSKPCTVFLNGEYWGFYWIMEEICEEYLTEHYSLPKDEAVIIKNGHPKTEGEKSDACIDAWNDLADADEPIDDALYEKICNAIDIFSYIDYYAAEIYIARGYNDWPRYNEASWRSTEDLGTNRCDGKWRWMLFDTNWSCLDDWEDDTIAYTMEHSSLFARLMAYKPFKQAFLDRLETLGDYEFDPIRLAPEFSYLCELLREPAAWDLKQYYGDNKSAEEFDEEIASIATFLQNRPTYIKDLVESYRK
ncbi:MAG: hypothetical protein E7300_09590 [Lachnospiraceae bacterium]|nr:hypothetical protein [Lachnospiraceae bacterium]